MMIAYKSEALYIAAVILLFFNKIGISFFGAKLRQHWLNPGFSKNFDKIQDRFRSLVNAQNEAKAGIKRGMTPQERASSLSSSGLPDLSKGKKKGKGVEKEIERIASLDESDESEEEDDTSFGIIPKSRILSDTR